MHGTSQVIEKPGKLWKNKLFLKVMEKVFCFNLKVILSKFIHVHQLVYSLGAFLQNLFSEVIFKAHILHIVLRHGTNNITKHFW